MFQGRNPKLPWPPHGVGRREPWERGCTVYSLFVTTVGNV